MGNFGGHALPGSFFIIFAIWWTVQTFREYYRSLSKTGHKYRSTVTSKCCCCPERFRGWPWEGGILIFFTTVGFTLEIITGFKHGQFVHIGNGQHATMFFFFGMCGAMDIVVRHWKAAPRGLDYAMMTLAFTVEALLFRVHIQGRPPMDVLLHTLLVYTVYGAIAACLMELAFPRNPLARLTRAFFTLVQGTWFWQLAFILYNPMPGAVPWKDEDHNEMMVVTMMFAWHMAGCLIVMLGIGALIGSCFYCRGDIQIHMMRTEGGEHHNGLLKHQDPEMQDGENSDTSL